MITGSLKQYSCGQNSPCRKTEYLAALATHGVDFAVVGGMVVIRDGYPRLTLDLDILVERTPRGIR